MQYVEVNAAGGRNWLPDEPGLREAIALLPRDILLQFAGRSGAAAVRIGNGAWHYAPTMPQAIREALNA